MSASKRRRIAGEPGPRAGAAATPPAVPVRKAAEPQVEVIKPKVPSAQELAAPRRIPLWLTLIALVVFAGGAALLVKGVVASQQDDTGDGPADAAQIAITTIDTFDYVDMKGHDDKSVRLMTEEFAANKKNWQPLTASQAVENQARGAAVVSAAATMWCSRDCSDDGAKVLVFYDQQLDAKDFKKPKLAMQRAIVTMVRVDGRWLVDGIERIKSAGLQ